MDNGLIHYCRLRKCKRQTGVLILIVVDNGIVPEEELEVLQYYGVLILVVVDNGIVHVQLDANERTIPGLNPCCSGQWYRTSIC